MTDTHIDQQKRSCLTPSGAAGLQETQTSLTCTYQIRVKDHLDPCWTPWFDDWTLTHLEDGEFLLSRAKVDHSALHGVLNKILDLNLTLISVTRVPDQNEKA